MPENEDVNHKKNGLAKGNVQKRRQRMYGYATKKAELTIVVSADKKGEGDIE
jgi:hypothetical protein